MALTQILKGMLGAKAVTTSNIDDKAVGTGQLADGAVGTTQLADLSVTPGKLAQKLTLGTAQAATSGTFRDFTGIPAWVNRITVMFNGVSTSGTSAPILQLGGGSVETTGYSTAQLHATDVPSTAINVNTAGFPLTALSAATNTFSGHVTLCHMGGNVWTAHGAVYRTGSNNTVQMVAGVKGLAGALDRVRMTTANGTDTFDAGSINILYEG